MTGKHRAPDPRGVLLPQAVVKFAGSEAPYKYGSEYRVVVVLGDERFTMSLAEITALRKAAKRALKGAEETQARDGLMAYYPSEQKRVSRIGVREDDE